MRSTAPAAVAASISCSRARLVALRRQVRAVPAVHMTIGRISATQSSRFRSAPRCRSPQHARRREVPSRSTRPTTSATSDAIAQLGMSRRAGLHLADDRTDLGCRAESPDPLTRARAHADAVRENAPGCHQPIVVHRRWRHTRTGRRRQRRRPARIPTPCSPRFPVNDRTPGTALAVYLAGTGRGRRHQTHDGRRRGHLESCFQSDGRRGDGNKSSIRQPK